MSAPPLTLAQIVENGLCIGCGLCKSIAGPDRVDLLMTPAGRERPVARRPLDHATLKRINAVCPGTRIGGPSTASMDNPPLRNTVWGRAEKLSIGYARDPLVRHRGSSGGVLTALGQFLLASSRVRFILHVAASKSAPMRTERRLSFDAATELYEAAVAAGALTIEREATFADFDRSQPHQVRKRRAVWARLKGRELAGQPVPLVTNLDLEDCARQNPVRENIAECRGARDRAGRGALGEPPVETAPSPR